MAIMKVPSYSVITTTTYSDGTVTQSSDHGEHAMATGFIMKVIWFVVGYFAAGFATIAILAIQLFTFITKFSRVRNKSSYLITLAVIITFFFAGPTIAMRLAPVFDPVHFNPTEIVNAVETAKKNLYAGNFNYSLSLYAKKKERESKSFQAHITYTKANDTTVIDITSNSEKIRPTMSQQMLEQIYGIAEKAYMSEFDKGKNTIPLGRYTFVGDVLVDSVVNGSRELSAAAAAEITKLLPVNFIFNKILENKNRYRIVPIENVSPDWNISLGHPEGANKKEWAFFNLLKTGEDYKLFQFNFEPYEGVGLMDIKIEYK